MGENTASLLFGIPEQHLLPPSSTRPTTHETSVTGMSRKSRLTMEREIGLTPSQEQLAECVTRDEKRPIVF
jgi:hypothetical protein